MVGPNDDRCKSHLFLGGIWSRRCLGVSPPSQQGSVSVPHSSPVFYYLRNHSKPSCVHTALRKQVKCRNQLPLLEVRRDHQPGQATPSRRRSALYKNWLHICTLLGNVHRALVWDTLEYIKRLSNALAFALLPRTWQILRPVYEDVRHLTPTLYYLIHMQRSAGACGGRGAMVPRPAVLYSRP